MRKLVLPGAVVFVLTFNFGYAMVFWVYVGAGIIAFTRRLIREFRRAYQAVRARQAADEAARQAADRLAEVVGVRRIARSHAIRRANLRAA